MSEKFVLKNVRLSFEHIFRPSAVDEDSDPKYSGEFLIPKDNKELLRAVKNALEKALEAKFPEALKNGKWPSNYHNPLKDGDDLADRYPEYEGHYVLKASSTRRPVAVDRHKSAVTEDDDIIYSGCFVNASLAADSFDRKAKKGVTVYLNGVQFVSDGERLGGSNAADDFDDLDGDDDIL